MKQRAPVVGRLAPSPTGAQHLGNARTYLLAWLAARAAGGRLILRIEDIDSPRVKPWAIEQAAEDLAWLGLDWDEGPNRPGRHGPYLQTLRTADYDRALQQLIDADAVYPCRCSRRDIEQAASAPHESPAAPGQSPAAPGQSPAVSGGISKSLAAYEANAAASRYPGTCAGWRRGDPLPTAADYCWRFRLPDEPLTVRDQLLGEFRLNAQAALGDFPVTRKNQAAAYQLAVVVDDAAMGVNQVVRGDDLLPSLVRQRAIQRVLGLPAPEYFHVPLVLGSDGHRLAKRHGDTRLATFRKQGVAAERIIGWAAHSLRLRPSDAALAAAELLEHFAWERIHRQAVTVDDSRFLLDR